MKLNHLYIERYNLLKEFTIDFDKQVSILIGVNGSGKSSVLEAIAQIFSDAILGERSKFGFRIDYELRLDELQEQTATTGEFRTDYIKVEISASDSNEILLYKVFVADKIIETKEDIENRFNDFYKILPSNIVIYYSGLSDIMKGICEPHDLELSKQYRKGLIPTFRPFFYFEPPLFGIILLSLLSYEYGDIPEFLEAKAKIGHLQCIQIKLKRPERAKRKKITDWWGAGIEITNFLNFLSSQGSPLIFDGSQKEEATNGNILIEAIGEESIIISIIGQTRLFQIREHLLEEKKLFEMLNTLYIDGFLDDIEFSFNKANGQAFNNLSEGEKQAIIIKGLAELVAGENTLFLFDEPDTYLHPSWQRDFIEEIILFTKEDISSISHYIITTHSPNLLSNANPEVSEVKIMEAGETIKLTPKYYGRDISTILYEMMGVDERIKKVAKRIDDLFDLIEDENLSEARNAYDSLASLLGEDDPVIVRARTQLDYLEEDSNEADK